MHKIIAYVLTAALALAGAAQAAGPVSVSPATVQVNQQGASTVIIRWRVGVDSSVPATIQVTSPTGTLSIGGATGGVLSRTVRHPGTGRIFVTFTERFFVDRTTARRLAQGGTATYSRSFTDINGTSRVASVRLNSGSGGQLSFRNVDIRFDDDTGFRTVEPGSALTARLVLTSAGSGIFEGAWEIAGPSGSAGTGFRPIARVRRVLAGARRTVIESPPLPTASPGTYRVRFVPGSGIARGQGETTREIIYTVAGSATVPRLELLAPRAGSVLTTASTLSWRPVTGAARYRIEFLQAGGGGVRADVIAAMDIAGTSARPRGITLRRLRGRSEIYWRVTAFDGAGNPIVTSPARRAGGGS